MNLTIWRKHWDHYCRTPFPLISEYGTNKYELTLDIHWPIIYRLVYSLLALAHNSNVAPTVTVIHVKLIVVAVSKLLFSSITLNMVQEYRIFCFSTKLSNQCICMKRLTRQYYNEANLCYSAWWIYIFFIWQHMVVITITCGSNFRSWEDSCVKMLHSRCVYSTICLWYNEPSDCITW